MKVSRKIRLYPTKEQEKLFIKFSNCARWAWNESLAYRIDKYENHGLNTIMQDCIERIQELKYNNIYYEWVQKIPESITKRSIKDLDKAFKNFFKSGFGFPKFKKKGKSKLSFYQREDNFRQIDENHIKITGIKTPVKIKKTWFPMKLYNIRVSFDGKFWYLSFSFDIQEQTLENLTKPIGVDLGIKQLAVVSDGRVYNNINKQDIVKKLERRKNRLQSQLSRKYEHNRHDKKYIKTSNIIKLEHKIVLIDRRLKNIRNTYIHDVTTDLVRTKPSKIVIEDLNIRDMMKNKHLSKAIQQQEFYKVRQYLAYKCKFYGIELVIEDRFYPSSKLCSCCGNVKKRLSLSERTYSCGKCGLQVDRDYNASINLSKYNKDWKKIVYTN